MVHVILWLILDHADIDWQVTISLLGANLISLSCFACRFDLRDRAENQQKELNLNKINHLWLYKVLTKYLKQCFQTPRCCKLFQEGVILLHDNLHLAAIKPTLKRPFLSCLKELIRSTCITLKNVKESVRYWLNNYPGTRFLSSEN